MKKEYSYIITLAGVGILGYSLYRIYQSGLVVNGNGDPIGFWNAFDTVYSLQYTLAQEFWAGVALTAIGVYCSD